jgi:hypothetical protein
MAQIYPASRLALSAVSAVFAANYQPGACPSPQEPGAADGSANKRSQALAVRGCSSLFRKKVLPNLHLMVTNDTRIINFVNLTTNSNVQNSASLQPLATANRLART